MSSKVLLQRNKNHPALQSPIHSLSRETKREARSGCSKPSLPSYRMEESGSSSSPAPDATSSDPATLVPAAGDEGALSLLAKLGESAASSSEINARAADLAKQAKRELQVLEQAGGELWVESFDPQRGTVYYYGSISGKVTWVQPASYVMAADDELMRAVLRIQCAWRARTARRILLRVTAQRKRAAVDADLAAKVQAARSRAAAEQAAAEAAGVEHWVEAYDPERGCCYYRHSGSGQIVWDPPEQFIPAADDDLMCAVIRIQCIYRMRVAKRRAEAQVALLDSRAPSHEVQELADVAAATPVFEPQIVFADAEDYDPDPIIVSPPPAPGYPTARGVGAREVLLIWMQPETQAGDAGGDGFVLTFNTVCVRPVIDKPDDRQREIEFVVPVTEGEARYVVMGLQTARSYTFQVKARNIEGYGPWSPPSNIATPVDPHRFHFPISVHLGSPSANYCMGEVVVARDTLLSEVRAMIRDQLRARGDGYRPDFEQRPQRAMSLLQARLPHPDQYVFTFMDGTAIKRTEEGRIRALDFRRQGEELLDEDGDGEGDCNTHIYLQYLHDARVVDTEVHEYRGELKPEHVKFSKTGQAIVHRPHRVDDDFVHPWDNEHTVVMHHVER